MNTEKIRETDTDNVAYTLYATIHGAVAVEPDLIWTDKALEPQPRKSKDPIKNLREYLFEQLKKILEPI
jgi:hypothetical protein